MEHPVLQNRVANVGTLSTTAARRVVVVNTGFDPKHAPYVTSKFCAEPSPDVTENIITSLTTKGDASGKIDTTGEVAKLEAQAKVELAKAFQNTGSNLFRRTQGSQFLRDGLFNLCNAYINGAVTEAEYRSMYDALSAKASDLIKEEFRFMYLAAPGLTLSK